MLPETVVSDLRHGLRLFVRNPGSTLLAVLALAAGIAINTAVYTAYKAMVARPLDARAASSMVSMAVMEASHRPRWSFSYPDYEVLRDSVHSFQGLIAYRPAQLTISKGAPGRTAAGTRLGRALFGEENAGAARFASVFMVSANYFRVLGVALLRGRDFDSIRPAELREHPIVLISENYWQRHFSGAEDIVGRTVFLNGVPVTIAGITPHDFCGTSLGAPAFWAPIEIEPLLHSDDNFLRDREAQRYRLFGRLAPHAGIAQAREEVDAAIDGLRSLHDPHSDAAQAAAALVWPGSPFPLPLREYRGLVLSIALVMAAAALVLIVACANVASLQVARMRARDDEMRIRLALGAGRGRIVRQLVTESAMMGLVAGALALFFTWILLRGAASAAANIFPGEYGGLVFDVTPDLAIFAYVSAISLVAGLISGLTPAIESSRAVLKPASSGGTATAGTRRLQDFLITAQVALSLILTVAATMAVRSSIRAVAIDTGYEARQVVALNIQFPDSLKYPAARKRALMEELRTRLERLPGVASVTHARIPADTGFRTAAATLDHRQTILHYTYVQPNYFETLGIPLLLGSGFTPGADRAVVLSESAAREFWGGQNPIGRTVRLGPTDEVSRLANDLSADGPSYQVVGIARDTRTADFSATVSKRVYLRLPDDRAAAYSILVRVRSAHPSETIRRIEPLLASLDPNLVATAGTLEDLLRQTASFIVAMLAALVASVVGLFGLVLAIMGIYGTVSYIVVLRTREVGIRMAIGAQVHHVLWAVLRESARPLLAGLAVGTLLAALMAHFARGLLFGLDGIDVASQALVALAFLAIGLLASCPPAYRATRIDPLVALRQS